MEDLPRIARQKPYYFEPEKGKRYLWCSCGLSAQQPFCDGSHKGTEFLPIEYKTQIENEEVLFCGCKHSLTQPLCDGAHNNLTSEYDEDDPNSEENRRVPIVEPDGNGLAALDGGCFVVQANKVTMESHGVLKLGELIGRRTGASYQSQFYAEIQPGSAPIMAFGDSEVVLLVASGAGTISISGRDFEVPPREVGIYIQGGEAFALTNTSTDVMTIYISVCPLDSRPVYPDEMPGNFNGECPDRLVEIDPDNRQSMADRFFQMLVDKKIGSNVVTQFIGEVPRSKAAMHRHLYEESIVVISGEGYMWTENAKTKVTQGSVIFLPRKKSHSLESCDDNGLVLAGVIYPGDNPSINY
ncbi:MAG: CDGSH iron-sulfur domain-containing protein [Halioglobus sp.]